MKTTALLALLLAAIVPATAGQHPRLLITPADLPRMRHAAGTGAAGDAGLGVFGRRSAELRALREHFAAAPADTQAAMVLPGETLASAALILLLDDEAQAGRLVRRVEAALQSPSVFADEWLERIIALDWTWSRIDPQVRTSFLIALRQRLESFAPTDHPTNHAIFRERLVGLAAVVAFDETDDPTSAWRETRKRILDAAKTYFADVFPLYLQARGRIPASPGGAGWEESDIILAIELASGLPGGRSWADHAGLGRLLEHYVVASTQHPALQSQFLRDDPRTAAPTPAPAWEALLPISAHLLAVRTRDPAAAAVAARVERALVESGDRLLAMPWRWTPIVFDLSAIPAADPTRLPAARNLDGAIVFRGGREPLSRVVWIDAGQKLLSASQGFDAGGFLIRSGGELAVSAADSLWQLAVPDRQGVQRLGASNDPFDYAQFAGASIAHNCMLVFEATRVVRWRGRVYAPIGGQKPVEGDCRDFQTPLESQSRAPSRLTAYAVDERSAYAALDLAAAYDERNLKRYTREFLWLGGQALLIVDRVELADPRARPTWVLNLPARPTLAGRELPPEKREAGPENTAGIWRFDGLAETAAGETAWIRTHDRDGALWIAPLLPDPAALALVGGPARAEPTAILEPRPVTYVGGSADSFEHRVLPSRQARNENAWFRIKDLPSFAAGYARAPHWGRLEIEARSNTPAQLFVTLLVPTDADARPPQRTVELGEESITIGVTLQESVVRAKILLGTGRIDPPTIFEGERAWTPAPGIQPDGPLPTR